MGISARGSSDVTGIGIGSKIHQLTQSMAVAPVTTMGVGSPAVTMARPAANAASSPGTTDFLGFIMNLYTFSI
jgi:hypothetical protein